MTLLLVLLTQSLTSINSNYQITCISVNNSQVTLQIWNPQLGSKYRNDQASKDAIHALLFSGHLGNNNCENQAPLLKSQAEIAEFKKIQRAFFSKKGDWLIFTRNSSLLNIHSNTDIKSGWKVYKIIIAKDELRKYLEKQKIINSLNHGF
jgi:hypothetical protein